MRKMRRGLLFLPLIVPLFVVGLSSCDVERGELLKIEYVSGLKEKYVVYSEINLNAVKVEAVFENATLDVLGKDLTFDPALPITDVVGTYNLKISYLEKSITWTYDIVDLDEIENVGLPESIRGYQTNIEEKGENKRIEFMDREQGYFVGTDNPWKFLPEIYAYDGNGDEIDVNAYHSSSKVYEKRGSDFVLLSGAELEAVVTIDEYRSTYHFKSAAHGKTYHLSVRPAGEKYASLSKYEASFDFNVTKGYNVTKQDDLLHFDNVNVEWDAYRTLKSITPADISGLIFHNDIKIKSENIANGFKYLEGDADVKAGDADIAWDYSVIGSMRDFYNLYERNIAQTEEFVFNGNYFNVDYTELPYVVREAGKIAVEPGWVISHVSLLSADGTEGSPGKFIMKNLSATGNANRTEEGVKSGGGLFLKVKAAKTHFYNNIVKQAFTAFISENDTEEVLIEKTRGYDTYSSLLYCWGTNDFVVKDSEFIGAGGPVLIADHVSPDINGDGGYVSHVKVINSKLESWVFGQENWFKLVHAEAVVGSIVALGEGLLNYGTNTIIRGQMINGVEQHKFNLIGVVKDGGAQAPSSSKIKGSFQIDETVGLDIDGPFMRAVAPFPATAPRLQSSGGQMALMGGSVENPYLVDSLNSPIIPSGQNYFSGDYMNLYYSIGNDEHGGHMGIVFGLADYITE